jgi:hypothetical protein
MAVSAAGVDADPVAAEADSTRHRDCSFSGREIRELRATTSLGCLLRDQGRRAGARHLQAQSTPGSQRA